MSHTLATLLLAGLLALLDAPRPAAQQAPGDSAHVARVLALLEPADSSVCELAGQALANGASWRWEPRRFPTPMPMPMPTPMPMPMAAPRGVRGPHVTVHVHGAARITR